MYGQDTHELEKLFSTMKRTELGTALCLHESEKKIGFLREIKIVTCFALQLCFWMALDQNPAVLSSLSIFLDGILLLISAKMPNRFIKSIFDVVFTYWIGIVVTVWWRGVWNLMDEYFTIFGVFPSTKSI